MRFKNKDQIVQLAKQYFGTGIKLYLFGSRVDDTKKGGDIDIMLESTKKISMKQQLKFLSDIYRNITQRKIDLLIYDPSIKLEGIYKQVKETGVILC